MRGFIRWTLSSGAIERILAITARRAVIAATTRFAMRLQTVNWQQFPELTPQNYFAGSRGLSRTSRRYAACGTSARCKAFTAALDGIGIRESSIAATNGFLRSELRLAGLTADS